MASTVTLSKSLYPLEVIYGTSYMFIESCYVRLEMSGSDEILVHFKAKDADDDLETIEGEFSNELLNQAYRHSLSARTGKVRDLLVERALGGALARDPLDELASDDLDFLDDPLGIAVPWEEKFSKDDGEKKEGEE